MLLKNAPCANPVFFKSYSRFLPNRKRESWEEVCTRTIDGLIKLGKLSQQEIRLIKKLQREFKVLPSGRYLWCGNTKWLEQPENYPGVFNCCSTTIDSWDAFGLMMELAMMGCGTGAVLEPEHISQLPPIVNQINLKVLDNLGKNYLGALTETELVFVEDNRYWMIVGDSRQGWVKSYQHLLELASDPAFKGEVNSERSRTVELTVDLSCVRPKGTPLKGFGGVANPSKLPDLYPNVVKILNQAIGRQLTAVECCLLIDVPAIAIVAGNIRRSAGIRQFSSQDLVAAKIKLNLWQQDESGNWRIDPERDALRMANHTRVFHQKPTLEECIDSVRLQWRSGEGAIQWAGEAIARASRDILYLEEEKQEFIRLYNQDPELASKYLQKLFQDYYNKNLSVEEAKDRLQRYGLNPCGEIIMHNNFCNLAEVPLNLLDPNNEQEQEDAFKAAALISCSLLNRGFTQERYQKSRELDPIIGVSFTGLFDFFVKKYGVLWLRWWQNGRFDGWLLLDEQHIQDYKISADDQRRCIYLSDWFLLDEERCLTRWRQIVTTTSIVYCQSHGLKVPNRCTTVQPSGTKALLSNSSPGWHPPKYQYFIRRITLGKEDPIALACIEFGYTVVPSQSDKDENGQLLTDPYDPRCSEWLVEIPVAVSWADLPGVEEIDVSEFSALAQFNFFMQVQKHYTTHNTSATIECFEEEIEPLGERIYRAIADDEGYISATVMARSKNNKSFPRLPFEPISRNDYLQMQEEVAARRISDNFYESLNRLTPGNYKPEELGAAPCDSDACLREK